MVRVKKNVILTTKSMVYFVFFEARGLHYKCSPNQKFTIEKLPSGHSLSDLVTDIVTWSKLVGAGRNYCN